MTLNTPIGPDPSLAFPGEGLSLNRVFAIWWPLAASWLLMAIEQPLVATAIARLPDREVPLAAWGGITFSLALIIQAPMIMMLAAATALSRGWASCRILRRYLVSLGLAMAGVHVLVAFSPLYGFLAISILSVPSLIVEPGRIGRWLMVPWTGAIAFRRFNQGELIRSAVPAPWEPGL